ncbi:hypothetical protein J416_06742 [Gracilibacillus halophilus YIM-C55.5]|uniref:DUF3993 domain-containing protein n=1 Tax=Gracilibacillus halophilus YIM-C55.5 TaxID=1308866 RepID=N4WVM6_9BACI|nr:hypothetical protein [Gracilibacillus halophilus]ENH97126.1 hypothetical protein J416_06742 [Gracilibacillus halophilus YIM-C55.5]
MKKISIMIITVLCLSIFTATVIQLQSNKQQYTVTSHAAQIEKTNTQKTMNIQASFLESQHQLTHEDIVKKTDQFMDTLVQDIDKNYRVKNYDTKKELLSEFESFMNKEVAKPYIDFYYKEKEEGLYIVPTETPAWFDNDNTYEKIEEENEHVVIQQTNQTDLYGEYTITIGFEYIDGTWKISSIDRK